MKGTFVQKLPAVVIALMLAFAPIGTALAQADGEPDADARHGSPPDMPHDPKLKAAMQACATEQGSAAATRTRAGAARRRARHAEASRPEEVRGLHEREGLCPAGASWPR